MSEIVGYKEKSSLIFMRNGQKARFDLADNSCYVTKNYCEKKVPDLKNYFRGLKANEVIASFSDVKYQAFLKHISKSETRCSNVGTFLERLSDYSVLENYYLLDIKLSPSHSTLNRITKASWEARYYGAEKLKEMNILKVKPTSFYNKDVLKFMAESNVFFGRIWESIYTDNTDLLTNIVRHIRSKHQNDFEVYRLFASMFNSNSNYMEHFKELVTRYNYDYKRLVDHLLFYVRGEGLDLSYAVGYLKDYARMQSAMSNSYDKYVKYLKSVHDIVSKNFANFTEKYEEAEFLSRVDTSLEYKYGYMVIAPKESKDIKDEGVNLHHCVASYIKQVIAGTCQILFLREEENESLVTLEVRNGELRQARGLHNRSTSKKEQEFLERWCKAKELKYGL